MNLGWAMPTFFRYMSEKRREISVRKAQPEDAEAICDVHIASVRTLCAKDYTPEQIEAWVGKRFPEKYRNAIANLSETIFVAHKGEEVVGFAWFFEYEVRAVYVHPSYTRQGVGTLLLEAVEREAVAGNIDKLKLSASITAERFYQSCGYQAMEHGFHTLRSGVQIPCIHMEKSLLVLKFPNLPPH